VATKTNDAGEPGVDLTPEEIRFLNEVAFPALDATKDDDTLKHFADVWWNLCLWEKQRADVIDAKATGLLGLSSIASAVVAATNLTGQGRAIAASLFLIAAICAVIALFVRDHSGFVDTEVFGALAAGTKPVGVSKKFSEEHAFRGYLREIVMQRWLIYRNFKSVSETRAKFVQGAQGFAVLAILVLCVVLFGIK
jgi:hypothetical protein